MEVTYILSAVVIFTVSPEDTALPDTPLTPQIISEKYSSFEACESARSLLKIQLNNTVVEWNARYAGDETPLNILEVSETSTCLGIAV